MNECPSEADILDLIFTESEGGSDEKLSSHINECSECKPKYENLKNLDSDFQNLNENKSEPVPEVKKLGQFEIIEEIGIGGMGQVYKAYDSTLDRFVAIKLIKDDLKNNDLFKKRFLFEAKIIAKLKHRNIVQVYQCTEEDNQFFLVMEYIDGIVLSKYPFIESEGFNTRLNFFKQALEGLKCAHDSGIIHRDIKTSNIMVSKTGEALLLDFGIAKSEVEDQKFTMTGDILGTVSYMAPEITVGEKASNASDLYAMGVVLYEMITRQVPFKSSTPLSTLHLIRTKALPDISAVVPDIPIRLKHYVEKLCHKKPENRFQNCIEAIDELNEILKGADIPYLQTNVPNNEQTEIYHTEASNQNTTYAGPGEKTIKSIADDMGISTRRAKAALNVDTEKTPKKEEPQKNKPTSTKKKIGCIALIILPILLLIFIVVMFFLMKVSIQEQESYAHKQMMDMEVQIRKEERRTASMMADNGNDYLLIKLPKFEGDNIYTSYTDNLSSLDRKEIAKHKTDYIVMKFIRAGSFMMGAPINEKNRNSKFDKYHHVSITTPFYISIYEVTQEQYRKVMGTIPNLIIKKSHPIANVSWNEIRGGKYPKGLPSDRSFMGKLSKLTGMRCDLPTEAQWEYAGRAGSIHAFNNNTNPTGSKDENMNKLGRYHWNGNAIGLSTAEVGSYLPNNWGIYDIHGNVSEICLDYFIEDRTSLPNAGKDPTGPTMGEMRVRKGMHYAAGADIQRIARRDLIPENHSNNHHGFRLVINL